MSQTVSFETAKQLKEAGFPQPGVDFGQIWFWRNHQPYFHVRAKPYMDGSRRFCDDNGNVIFEHPMKMIFAPTATDILRNLPGWFSVFSDNQKKWHCLFQGQDGVIYSQFIHKENPAEACAQAWLELRKA